MSEDGRYPQRREHEPEPPRKPIDWIPAGPPPRSPEPPRIPGPPPASQVWRDAVKEPGGGRRLRITMEIRDERFNTVRSITNEISEDALRRGADPQVLVLHHAEHMWHRIKDEP